MMDLMGLYRLAEDNDIAVDCFELKSGRPFRSWIAMGLAILQSIHLN